MSGQLPHLRMIRSAEHTGEIPPPTWVLQVDSHGETERAHVLEARDPDTRLMVPDEPTPPRIPDPPGEIEEADEIFDAEIEWEEETSGPASRFLPGITGRVVVVRPAPWLVTITRGLVVHTLYVLLGYRSWLTRAADALTFGTYRRQIRGAEATNDRDALEKWVQLSHQAKMQRHTRLMDLPLLAVGLVKFTLITLAGVAVLLLLLSFAVWLAGLGSFTSVFVWIGNAIRWVLMVLGAIWAPLLIAVVLVWPWREGRRHASPPRWLVAPADRDNDGEPITPSAVVLALRELGVTRLRKAIENMGDAGGAMLSHIRIAGCGDEVDVYLPTGVFTKDITDRRRKLAENLGRHEHELFIAIPAARVVRLWIANSGALDQPIGPSPLVTDHDIKADYKRGLAPWGQNLRGDPAGISLYQRHLLITGLSNQGKTAALRALALWLAFDPRVKFRIADLKGHGDWSMFEGIADVLIQGPTDEHVAAATEMVEWGVAEMERRLQAPAGSTFDPVILIVDEAQVAFMCPAKDEFGNPYGGSKFTSRYFMAVRKIQNQGRAVDDLLWQGTQNPTDQNLPVLVREGAHIRASLVVGTESQAKMALGDTPVAGGAAPHLLRQDLDRGTIVANGVGMKLPPGDLSITLRTHYVSTDEAHEVAKRIKAIRGRAVRSAPAEMEERDLLDDVHTILTDVPNEERIKVSDLPAALRRLAPAWKPYEDLVGTKLAAKFEHEYGIRVTNPQNVLRVAVGEIRRAWAMRQGGE